jgi:hypothetical protein
MLKYGAFYKSSCLPTASLITKPDKQVQRKRLMALPLKQYMHTYDMHASFNYSTHLLNNLYVESTQKDTSQTLEE